jgi:hypothetical protein
MNRKDVDTFEKLTAQLGSTHSEISILSKKSRNDALNKFKVKLVNAVLEQCNSFFGDEYKPFSDFSSFVDDDLPSNSDVTFVISQYMETAEKFRSDNIFIRSGQWWWRIDDEQEGNPTVRTALPKKLTSK